MLLQPGSYRWAENSNARPIVPPNEINKPFILQSSPFVWGKELGCLWGYGKQREDLQTKLSQNKPTPCIVCFLPSTLLLRKPFGTAQRGVLMIKNKLQRQIQGSTFQTSCCVLWRGKRERTWKFWAGYLKVDSHTFAHSQSHLTSVEASCTSFECRPNLLEQEV